MRYSILILAALFLATVVAGQKIKKVGHRDLYPIKSKLGGIYKNYRKFQPAVRVSKGCVPFPAVGRYKMNGGLKIGGAIDGQCTGNAKGNQVYARHMNFRKGKKRYRGIMYAYYFPKDQGSDGGVGNFFARVFTGGKKGIGHRHDWEEVVVFTTWNWSRGLAAALSGHGEYKAYSGKNWHGHHKKTLYARKGGVGTHEFLENSGAADGFRHPIANWYQLSKAVRYTLNKANFGKASCKINDGNFEKKMKEAWRVANKKF